MLHRYFVVFLLILSNNALSNTQSNMQYLLYHFHVGPYQDPLLLRLNSKNGDTWYFTGKRLEKIAEYGTKPQYRDPAYELTLLKTRAGENIFRFSRASGALWIYQPKGWVLVSTRDQAN